MPLDQATIDGPVFATVEPTVAIFDDMLEITSPGALPDGITPEATTEVTTEVPPEVRLVSVVDGEMSRKEIMERLELRDEGHFREAASSGTGSRRKDEESDTIREGYDRFWRVL